MKNSYPTIDQILQTHKSQIGKDYDRYKNHVYRVFNFCLQLDENQENIEKYAIVAAFHDIGIWTNQTFDYLEPSIEKSKEYLTKIGNESWSDEISIMIDMHHKRSRYRGPFEKTVEVFRKADWVDVTKGRKSFGIDKEVIGDLSHQYPTLGFHRFLVIQTMKNLLKSPLNPLPMFKK